MAKENKPFWLKFVGGPGDHKEITLHNLIKCRDKPELQDYGISTDFYQKTSKLNITCINRYAGVSDLHPAEKSEIFARLDMAITKANEDIEEIIENDYHRNFDVIVEGQPIEEIILYALAYRSTNQITDFGLSLLMKKFEETRKKLQKIQENVTFVYLTDEADDSYHRLTKRRRALEVYDANFVNAYVCIMFANLIKQSDNNLILRPSNTGTIRTQLILLEAISKLMEKVPPDSPKSPDYLKIDNPQDEDTIEILDSDEKK